MPNGDGIGIKNLEQALARYIEIGVETGVATGGSNTTLEDTTKSWEVNRWLDGDIHIVKDGVEYVRTITANTATVITFAALPVGVAAAAGDLYSVRRITVPMDITNRWARELGQIDLARVLGAALAHANPVLVRVTDGAAFYDLAREAQLTPLDKAAEHNTAETAATDILAAALAPTNTPCLFRIMVAFDTAGIFRATITRAANTQTVDFNSGGNLAASALYMFDHLVHEGDTINYQYSVNAQLMVLRVQEIVGGVQ